ncbi:MAG: glycoside hydrolase family 15 protein, partial [Alphaproteobacteria bacterium]
MSAAAMPNLDLGLIGNCAHSALIDRQGCIVWYCLPRFDGDPVFCKLIDDPNERGFFDVALEGGVARSEQMYLRNTAVLVTRLYDEAGACMQITDFAPRFSERGRRFRPLTLVRVLEPVAGTPRVRIRLRPAFDYGATAPEVTHGSNHIRYAGTTLTLRLTTDAPLPYVLNERPFLLQRKTTLILGPDERLRDSAADVGREFLERTIEYWRYWVRSLAIPFEWQDAVIRSAITLKLCAFEATGAIIAAATTSIPEAADSGRTWDYRYCWLRDAYFVVQAL